MIAPSLPPLDVYRLWVRAGHGRAVLVTNPDVPQDYKDEIIHYSLNDYRLDRQFGCFAGRFNIELATRAGIREQLRDALIEAEFEEEEMVEKDRTLRFRTLAVFAESGDDRSLAHLQKLVAENEPQALESYVEALVYLSKKGQDWAFDELTDYVRKSNEDAFYELSYYIPRGIIWLAEHADEVITVGNYWKLDEDLGPENKDFKDVPRDLLARLEAARDKAKEEFQRTFVREPRPVYVPSDKGVLADLLAGIVPRRLVPQAAPMLTEEDHLEVARRWLVEEDWETAIKLFEVIEKRGFPLPLSELIARVRSGFHPCCFEDVLEEINDPAIRELGLELVQDEDDFAVGIESLTKSVLPEDLDLLLPAATEFVLGNTGSQQEEHSVTFAFRDMAKHLPQEAAIRALVWVYENTGCGACRGYALEELVDDHDYDVSDWLEEMQYDTCSDVCEVAEKLKSGGR
ncbi:MAG: hypothetical protein JST35_01965 [Armatimonadetes bacterium]|nr:hypothetical protein [Armatimonadota bacterium]